MGNIFSTSCDSSWYNSRQTKDSEWISRKSLLSQVIAAEKEENDDDLEDPVERMLKKTGCLELHYSVQECIAESKDWRQCQQQVQDFKDCMKKYKKHSSRIRI